MLPVCPRTRSVGCGSDSHSAQYSRAKTGSIVRTMTSRSHRGQSPSARCSKTIGPGVPKLVVTAEEPHRAVIGRKRDRPGGQGGAQLRQLFAIRHRRCRPRSSPDDSPGADTAPRRERRVRAHRLPDEHDRTLDVPRWRSRRPRRRRRHRATDPLAHGCCDHGRADRGPPCASAGTSAASCRAIHPHARRVRAARAPAVRYRRNRGSE